MKDLLVVKIFSQKVSINNNEHFVSPAGLESQCTQQQRLQLQASQSALQSALQQQVVVMINPIPSHSSYYNLYLPFPSSYYPFFHLPHYFNQEVCDFWASCGNSLTQNPVLGHLTLSALYIV